jgi:hypothetical protein
LPLMQREGVGAIVAKVGILPDLEAALATHMRIHSAEGFFYREACQIPCRIIPPASLNITVVGKLTARPCGRDQKLAALAAWRVMTLDPEATARAAELQSPPSRRCWNTAANCSRCPRENTVTSRVDTRRAAYYSATSTHKKLPSHSIPVHTNTSQEYNSHAKATLGRASTQPRAYHNHVHSEVRSHGFTTRPFHASKTDALIPRSPTTPNSSAIFATPQHVVLPTPDAHAPRDGEGDRTPIERDPEGATIRRRYGRSSHPATLRG